MNAETAHPPLPPTGARRSVPVVGIVLGAWVVIWLLMMWHSDWAWVRDFWWNAGSPLRRTLRLFGALTPGELRWQSFFLAPLLQRSALSVFFLFFFWRSTGGMLVKLLGPSWTWVVFSLGGMAAAYAHVEAHPISIAPYAVGPFDPILCGVGVQLGWGLLHPEARGLMWGALKTLLFLCIFMLVMMLLSGLPVTELDRVVSPEFRERMGAEGMLGALVAGVALAFVITLGRRVAATPTLWLGRGVAVALALGTLTAAVTQAAPLLRPSEAQQAEDFLGQLRRVERSVKKLLPQARATNAMRDELARRHDRLMAHEFLEHYEDTEALRAYAKVLALYKRPVDAPFLTEPQLKQRFKVWYEEHEKPLREKYVLRPRPFDPWKDI